MCKLLAVLIVTQIMMWPNTLWNGWQDNKTQLLYFLLLHNQSNWCTYVYMCVCKIVGQELVNVLPARHLPLAFRCSICIFTHTTFLHTYILLLNSFSISALKRLNFVFTLMTFSFIANQRRKYKRIMVILILFLNSRLQTYIPMSIVKC